MLRIARRFVCVLAALPLLSAVAAPLPGVENQQRAQVNYMLNCQGCHGARGEGSIAADVPVMTDFVGRFLHVEGGRSFLVQVPGSANSALSDAHLAEVLNWMLPNISPAEMPADFEPYTAAEVGALRKTPLVDVISVRARLVNLLDQTPADSNFRKPNR